MAAPALKENTVFIFKFLAFLSVPVAVDHGGIARASTFRNYVPGRTSHIALWGQRQDKKGDLVSYRYFTMPPFLSL